MVGLLGIYMISVPLFIVIGLGMPTGMGLFFDIPFVCLVGILLLMAINFIFSTILGFIRINFPRLLLGSLFAAFMINSVALFNSNISYWASAIITLIQLMIGFSATTSIYLLLTKRYRLVHSYFYIGCTVLLMILSTLWLYDNVPSRGSESNYLPIDNRVISAIQASNPSHEGPFTYQELTYGSGTDRHREEFGEDVDIISRTIDGSHLIKRWSFLRKLFWGFDQSQLPLNGRMWLPQGEGPFPIAFIVHGNHLMEDFSDGGYAYLGQLLASRGIITVSVDENFINYSVWSGGLSNNIDLRAWVLQQHVEQIRQLNNQRNNPLFSKVDLNRIALIGHSRGGQAVVRAAENLNDDDAIRAIIAIAPTDFSIDDEYLINDINYMVLQGSQDGDVSTFSGDRQYVRTLLANNEYALKTSLYIVGANHGQFNTSWGSMDLSLPTGLFLSDQNMMNGQDQRRIAKTYIAAFLETTFNKTNAYMPMFKDYRHALQWLPQIPYINRFEANDLLRISDFDEDHNILTTSISGGEIHTIDFDDSEEIMVMDRQQSSKHNRSLRLSWTKPTAALEIKLPKYGRVRQLNTDSILTFSLANLTDEANLDFSIELETAEGAIVSKQLSQFNRLLPAIHTQFTKERFLDIAVRKGRYGASTEPVFQTMMIPLNQLVGDDEQFDYTNIQSIRFQFQDAQEGSILLDDIGMY